MNLLKISEEIGWLKKLSKGLKTISQEEFSFNDFVSEFNSEHNCGTVCCAFGWMPRFVPESGAKWERYRKDVIMNMHTDVVFSGISGIKPSVEANHQCLKISGFHIIDFLFYNRGFSKCRMLHNTCLDIAKNTMKHEFIKDVSTPESEFSYFFGNITDGVTLNNVINRIDVTVNLLEIIIDNTKVKI